MVPHGAAVVRHTALPRSGQSAEWILSEMQKMDDEAIGSDEWRNGKVSGAVYRMCLWSLSHPTVSNEPLQMEGRI